MEKYSYDGPGTTHHQSQKRVFFIKIQNEDKVITMMFTEGFKAVGVVRIRNVCKQGR